MVANARRRIDKEKLEAQAKRIDNLHAEFQDDLAVQRNSVMNIRDQVDDLQTTLRNHAGFGGRLAALGIELEGVKADLDNRIMMVHERCYGTEREMATLRETIEGLVASMASTKRVQDFESNTDTTSADSGATQVFDDSAASQKRQKCITDFVK